MTMSLMSKTVSVLHTFFLAMALNPDVVQHAWDELDRVINPGTLPTFEDRINLPYVCAIVNECLRYSLSLLNSV